MNKVYHVDTSTEGLRYFQGKALVLESKAVCSPNERKFRANINKRASLGTPFLITTNLASR